MTSLTLPQAVFLGLIQGLTEFLPISSSGHLVLLQKILGLAEPPVFFDVLVHLGTLAAVVLFFGREWERVLRARRVLRSAIVGTVPIVVVGLLVQPLVRVIFGSLLVVGVGYFLTAALLWRSRGLGEGNVGVGEINDRRALIIGLFQAVAILPGVSRSGATIVSGLAQKLRREAAFAFSFYLSLPAILGAMSLQLKDLAGVAISAADFLGFLTAFGVGYLSLTALRGLLLSGKLYLFSFYCVLLGLAAFSIFLTSR